MGDRPHQKLHLTILTLKSWSVYNSILRRNDKCPLLFAKALTYLSETVLVQAAIANDQIETGYSNTLLLKNTLFTVNRFDEKLDKLM